MKLRSLIALMALSLSVLTTNAQNLILNGSFETPGLTGNAGTGRQKVDAGSADITGWTVSDGDVYVCKSPDIGLATFTPAQDGSFYLDLSGDGPPHGTVYQDFSTIPGANYLLTFYIGASGWTSPFSTINVRLLGVGTMLNTNLTPLSPDGNNINWLKEEFIFVADANTTRLSFSDTSGTDDNASFIDSVVISIPSAPAIAIHPLTQNIGYGDTARFNVAVTNGAELVSYQWFFGTDPIDGATNKSLSLTNIQPTQAGNYFVVASNTVGSATSSISALNVIFPIAIEMTPTVVIKFAGIYDIQRIDGFGLANDWTTLMRVVVTNPPQSFYDTSYVGKTNEFYRLLKMINPH